MIEHPSVNFDQRIDGRIKYLILHYTGMATGKEALDRLCDAGAAVSSHYLIEENGEIYSLVDERYRAWHAGVSKWECNEDINDLSVGIEIVNPGHPYPGYESHYRAFTDAQMRALIPLAKSIIERHNIKNCHILGHSDVAWRRKIDPGELFDWKRLSQHGIGLWVEPDRKAKCHSDFLKLLADFGYDTAGCEDDATMLISAFQRHYRPNNIDGDMDDETYSILSGLVKLKIS